MDVEGSFRVESATVVSNDGPISGARMSVQWLLRDDHQGSTFPELVSSRGVAEWLEDFTLPASAEKFLTLELLLHSKAGQVDSIGVKQIDLTKAARSVQKKRQVLRYEASARLGHMCVELKLSLAVRPASASTSSSGSSNESSTEKTTWGTVSDQPALCVCSIGALFFPGDVARHAVRNVLALANVYCQPLRVTVKCSHPHLVRLEPRTLDIEPRATYYVVATWAGDAGPRGRSAGPKVLIEATVAEDTVSESISLPNRAYREAPARAKRWGEELPSVEPQRPEANPTPRPSPRPHLAAPGPVKRHSDAGLLSARSAAPSDRASSLGSASSPRSTGSDGRRRGPSSDVVYHYWVNEVCYTCLPLSEKQVNQVRRLLTALSTPAEGDSGDGDIEVPQPSLHPQQAHPKGWRLQRAVKQTTVVLQRLRLLGLFFLPDFVHRPAEQVCPAYSIAFKCAAENCTVQPSETTRVQIAPGSGLAAWGDPVTVLVRATQERLPEELALELQLNEHILAFADVPIASASLNIGPFLRRGPRAPSEPSTPQHALLEPPGVGGHRTVRAPQGVFQVRRAPHPHGAAQLFRHNLLPFDRADCNQCHVARQLAEPPVWSSRQPPADVEEGGACPQEAEWHCPPVCRGLVASAACRFVRW